MDYKKLSIGLGFVVAFLAGCVVHDVVRVAPPARAGTSPQKWEYACFSSYEATEIESQANAWGKQGWEQAGVGGTGTQLTWCFKRPLP